MMLWSGSSSAWRSSELETTTVRGRPETMSRPRISASGSLGSGKAEPRVIFISSAVRSPSIREYSFFIHAMIAWSRSSPAVRTRQAGDDAAEADHRDLGGAAADVDDHVAGGLVHGQPGADRGRHRLLDDVDPAGAGLVAGLLDRALLDGGDAARHADDHARLGEVAAPVHLVDEVAQHLLGRLEVGDHAVLERPDGGDVVGRAADHPLGLVTDREHLAGGGVHRHDGRLVEHDALAADIDQRVGGAEVHGHVSADEAPCCAIQCHAAAALAGRVVPGRGVSEAADPRSG